MSWYLSNNLLLMSCDFLLSDVLICLPIMYFVCVVIVSSGISSLSNKNSRYQRIAEITFIR